MKKVRALCKAAVTVVAVLVCLVLMVAGIGFLFYRIPIPKEHKLQDVGDAQPVMVAYFYDNGVRKCAAVTKTGKWKCADLTDAFQRDNSCPTRETKGFLGIIDEMMEDKAIPYQDTRLSLPKWLLEKTINMPEIDREEGMKQYYKNLGCVPPNTYYECYVVTGAGEERSYVRVAGTMWWTYPDFYVLLSAHKIEKLERMRQDVMGKL